MIYPTISPILKLALVKDTPMQTLISQLMYEIVYRKIHKIVVFGNTDTQHGNGKKQVGSEYKHVKQIP